jgi:hypothetical protein
MSLDAKFESILGRTARELVAAIRASLADEVARLGRGKPGKATRAAPKRAVRRHLPKHCVAPGCKNPHKGPRFSFCCEEHRTASKSAREKWRDAWRAKSA